MKRAANFRLSNKATATLSLLEKKMHTSKTAIVEKAIQYYAKKELSQQEQLLEFAGILSEKEAVSMLTKIAASKHDKDIEVDL